MRLHEHRLVGTTPRASTASPATGARRRGSPRQQGDRPVAAARPGLPTRVGASTDAAERMADRTARDLSGTTPGRRSGHASAGPVPLEVSHGIAAARGSGRPLPQRLREQVERALDTDLDAVRLHTGPTADGLNRALGAAAFTSGSDIFLGADTPGLDTPTGRAVLTHELAHVMQGQQDPGPTPIRRVLAPAHLGDPPNVSGWWPTRDGAFNPLDGKTPGAKKRAGTVEAIIPAGAPKGTPPNKDTLLGWHWVHQFGGTGKGNGGWVRFHLLNQQLGGSGDTKENLVPTSGATNQDPRWTTHFDERAKDAHDNGRHLHLIAKVDYHPQVTGPPALPGEAHQHFFPSKIEGEYRRWDTTSGIWKMLAKVNLAPIKKPPLNPSIVPVELGSASADQIKLVFPQLADEFVDYIVDNVQHRLDALPAGSSTQDVYREVAFAAEFALSNKVMFKNKGTAAAVRTLDRAKGWWPTLEALLRTPPASGGSATAKPLIVNQDVDLVGKPSATTGTDARAAADAAAAAAENKKRKLAEAQQKKKDDEARKKSHRSLDDMLAGMG